MVGPADRRYIIVASAEASADQHQWFHVIMHYISVSSCEFSYDPNDKRPDSHEATESDHGPIIRLDIEYAIRHLELATARLEAILCLIQINEPVFFGFRFMVFFALAIGIHPGLPGVLRAGSSSTRVLHAIGPGDGVVVYLSIRPCGWIGIDDWWCR